MDLCENRYFACGFGARISEESSVRTKPMVEIIGKPTLWRIMNIYSSLGMSNFLICRGYKFHIVKEYFLGKIYKVVWKGYGEVEIVPGKFGRLNADSGLSELLGRLRGWLSEYCDKK